MRVKLSNSNKFYSTISFIVLAMFLSYIFSFQTAQASVGYPSIPIQNLNGFTCTAGIGSVLLTGYINNGDTAFKVIFLKMLVLDNKGNVLATGYGNISNVKAHEATPFNAIARFSGNFTSCTVQIDSAIPK